MVEGVLRADGENALSMKACRSIPIPTSCMILCLAAASAIGSGPQPSAKETEAVEQLDAVEVTAARIAPQQRAIPMPLPDVSAATPLPSENVGMETQPEPAHPMLPHSKGLLRDETAATKGIRTRVRYLESESMRPP